MSAACTRHDAWWDGSYSWTAFGGDFGQGLEEKSVSGHGEQNPGHREHWTQEAGETNGIKSECWWSNKARGPPSPSPHDEERLIPGGQSAERSHSYYVFGWLPVDVFEGQGQGAAFVEQVVGHHQGESSRHGKVGQETDEQRGHDTHRNRLLRILHLLAYK